MRLVTKAEYLDQLQFRRRVANSLIRKFGVERKLTEPCTSKVEKRIPQDIRYDHISPFPGIQVNRTRCALCHSQTNQICKKCQTAVHTSVLKHTTRWNNLMCITIHILYVPSISVGSQSYVCLFWNYALLIFLSNYLYWIFIVLLFCYLLSCIFNYIVPYLLE